MTDEQSRGLYGDETEWRECVVNDFKTITDNIRILEARVLSLGVSLLILVVVLFFRSFK